MIGRVLVESVARALLQLAADLVDVHLAYPGTAPFSLKALVEVDLVLFLLVTGRVLGLLLGVSFVVTRAVHEFMVHAVVQFTIIVDFILSVLVPAASSEPNQLFLVH